MNYFNNASIYKNFNNEQFRTDPPRELRFQNVQLNKFDKFKSIMTATGFEPTATYFWPV